MGGKGEVKEKFSFCRFRLKKVKKVGKLRMGDKKICDAGARHMPNQESGYAAALPACFLTQERYLLSRRASRTLERDCCTVSFPRCRRDA